MTINIDKPLYMAHSEYAPQKGRYFVCRKIEKGLGEYVINDNLIETSEVTAVRQLAKNFYLAETINSIYLIRVLNYDIKIENNHSEEKLHLVGFWEMPEIGKSAKACEFAFNSYGLLDEMYADCTTTPVRRLKRISELYLAETTSGNKYIGFVF